MSLAFNNSVKQAQTTMRSVEESLPGGFNASQRRLMRQAQGSIAVAEGSADGRELDQVMELKNEFNDVLRKMSWWQRLLFKAKL